MLFDSEAALSAILVEAIAAAPPELDPWAAMILACRAAEPLFIENRASNLPKLAKTRALTVASASALRARGIADRLATLAAQIGLATLTHAVAGWLDEPVADLDGHIAQALQGAQNSMGKR